MNISLTRPKTPFTATRTRFLAAATLATAVLATAAVAALVPSAAGASTASSTMIGHLDSASTGIGLVTLTGWAADTADPSTPVDILVVASDGRTDAAEGVANTTRQDVARAIPGLGSHHGFSVTDDVYRGTYPVCAYSYPANNFYDRTLIGCVTLTVPADRVPIGHLDVLADAGNQHIQLAGWAADQDTPGQAVQINVYLGGEFGGTTTFKSLALVANRPRPDVDKALPGIGASHGFSATVAAKAGTYPVCVYAVNTYMYGTAALLGGCAQITVH